MSRPDVARRATELRADRVPFVHATVVLAERPTSAKPGDEAIIYSDGTIEGFVGGTCAESTVRAQGLALLDSGEPLLLRITPSEETSGDANAAAVVASASTATNTRLTVHNPCLSGGSLEIFLEPVVPAPVFVVYGDSPIASAVARLAGQAGYEVVGAAAAVTEIASAGRTVPISERFGPPDYPQGRRFGPTDDPDSRRSGPPKDFAGVAAVVVASHGRDEEEALLAALSAGVEYVGLVASRKRGESVVASLDVDDVAKTRIHTPAGLDIGAHKPEDVAISILAEIVAERRRPTGQPVIVIDGHSSAQPGTATDPVCGMAVATVETSLHLDHEGDRSWFCGTGCLRAFAADPAAYLAS